jgi:Ubiquitin-conjugating enzyme
MQDGTLCLDLIQDQWSPVQSVSTLLTSVQSLLTDPNCSVRPPCCLCAQLFLSRYPQLCAGRPELHWWISRRQDVPFSCACKPWCETWL